MTGNATRPRLNRDVAAAGSKAPVRIVHLGLGAFHRSHQAWYTQHAGDSAEWGIAAFTGRRPDAAEVLSEQDGVFTLVERSDAGDRFEVIGSIVEAVDGNDVGRLAELLAAPSTAIVTLTITEAAYSTDAAGAEHSATPLGRLAAALAARKENGAGPLAVVSCDNLAHNGTVTREAVLAFAEILDQGLADWVRANVSFVSTSVDRITPRTTAEDIAEVAAACGYDDAAPVVAEPFRNWVMSGSFPAGRPRWEDAGAVFVEDMEPYENRKLWLLNGAHSILAYAGQLRGHATVAEALDDPLCRDAVEKFWDEAARHLPDALGVPEYRAALVERFSNSRIAHHLAQIALDGTTKLRMRALPVLAAERAEGRSGDGAAGMIAAWMAQAASPAGVKDPLAAEIAEANTLDGDRRTRALLELLDPGLAADPGVLAQIHRLQDRFAASSTSASR
ncbi:mannitol dehydrogenase family protein [Paenarthrobacter ureafaciens]|uniref:mannitol dehydrogenase family protein n=1 Tax=Paenarthrobacter ureafaciens TaxID=37931 RepID=UPI001917950E|nr:mannitol dehydrogenase family protein [Paenarthrobacter ureafaciens]QQQ62724.1 mannitol dehydrogenase family protein [Paenarthrobacter ureafaciens]